MQPKVSDWICARLWFMSTGYPRPFSAGEANVISLECCEPPLELVNCYSIPTELGAACWHQQLAWFSSQNRQAYLLKLLH